MPIGKITHKLTEGIIKHYGDLEKLNLSSNEISIIEDASNLSTLRKLNLADNLLMGRQLVKLSVLTNLEELNLNSNRISLLEFFPTLPKLEILDIGDNVISDVHQIRHLHLSNPHIIEIVVGGNPFSSSPTSMLSLFTKLVKVDGRFFSEYGASGGSGGRRGSSPHSSPRILAGSPRDVLLRKSLRLNTSRTESDGSMSVKDANDIEPERPMEQFKLTPKVNLNKFFREGNAGDQADELDRDWLQQEAPVQPIYHGGIVSRSCSPNLFVAVQKKAPDPLATSANDPGLLRRTSSYRAESDSVAVQKKAPDPFATSANDSGLLQRTSSYRSQSDTVILASISEQTSLLEDLSCPQSPQPIKVADPFEEVSNQRTLETGAHPVNHPKVPFLNMSFAQNPQPNEQQDENLLADIQHRVPTGNLLDLEASGSLQSERMLHKDARQDADFPGQVQPNSSQQKQPTKRSNSTRNGKSLTNPDLTWKENSGDLNTKATDSQDNFLQQVQPVHNRSSVQQEQRQKLYGARKAPFPDSSAPYRTSSPKSLAFPTPFKNKENHMLKPKKFSTDDVSPDQIPAHVTKQLDALERQARAFKEALKLQEHAVSREAQTAEAAKRQDGNLDPEGSDFEQLLQLWRKQVIKLLMQAEMQKLSHENELAGLRRQLKQEASSRKNIEHNAKVQQQKVVGLEAELTLAQSRLAQQAKQISELVAHCQHLEHELSTEVQNRDAMERIAEAVEDFQAQEHNQNEANFLRATGKIDELDQRLSLALGRLSSLSVLMERKEVHLRNRNAALVADRRLWVKERGRQEEKALAELIQNPPEKLAETTTVETRRENIQRLTRNDVHIFDGLPSRRSEEESLLYKGLRPECEAVMRAVFCRLDRTGKGAVPAELLLKALRKEESIVQVMSRWAGGRASWTAALDEIEETLLEQSLHRGDLHQVDLTWGEFLLFFVPTPGGSDREQLEKKLVPDGNMNDRDTDKNEQEMMGLLQLQVPQGWLERYERLANARHGMSFTWNGGTLDSLTPIQLRTEVRRLAMERWYLIEVLRDDLKKQKFRDDEISYNYKKEIRLLKTKTRDLAWQCEHLKENQMVLSEKEKNVAVEAEMGRKHYEAAAQHWEQQIAQLEEDKANALEKAKKNNQVDIDAINQKYTRLEGELNLLRREHSKGLVRERTLERELARIKQTKKEEDTALTRDLQERLASREADLVSVRRERNALLATLRDQKKKTGQGSSVSPQEAHMHEPRDVANSYDRDQGQKHDRQESPNDQRIERVSGPAAINPESKQQQNNQEGNKGNAAFSRLNDLAALTNIFLAEDSNSDEDNDDQA